MSSDSNESDKLTPAAGLHDATRISRREAIRWVAVASGTAAVFAGRPFPTFGALSTAKPYGRDPDLTQAYEPGAFWPLTLDAKQRKTLVTLCDLMIPADEVSPNASKVGVPDFVDEWISAPYAEQQRDRSGTLEGLAWLEAESQRRFSRPFSDSSLEQQSAIADDICSQRKAKPEFASAARSFALLRSLILGGYYTTPAGWRALGYVGNVALAEFPEPPREVLDKLGLS